MARYAVEVGMMCYTLAVGMKLGVIVNLSLAKDLFLAVLLAFVILSLRRISPMQLDATKILWACPQNDG